MRGILGPKRDEKTREWRCLHNEEPNDLYSSTNVSRAIKRRRIRWVVYVERLSERSIEGFSEEP